MSAESKNQDYWRNRIQDYLDDSLPSKEAVEFFMVMQNDPALAAEVDAYRSIITGLESLPHATPSSQFDAAVLDRVPLEAYRSAPRLPRPVLLLGDASEALLERVVRPLGKTATALAAAYALVLLVSRSFLATSVSRASIWMSDSLASLAQKTSEVPVLSTVVESVAAVYDAAARGIAAVGTVTGPGVLTVVAGLALGVTVMAFVARRRQEETRTRA